MDELKDYIASEEITKAIRAANFVDMPGMYLPPDGHKMHAHIALSHAQQTAISDPNGIISYLHDKMLQELGFKLLKWLYEHRNNMSVQIKFSCFPRNTALRPEVIASYGLLIKDAPPQKKPQQEDSVEGWMIG